MLRMEDSSFVSTYRQSLGVFLGIKKAKFLKEEYTTGLSLEVEVSLEYRLMPESSFERIHGAKIKDMGLQWTR